MRGSPPNELEAFRRVILTGTVAFCIGAGLALTGLICLAVRVIAPDSGWVDAVGTCVRCLPFVLVAGFLAAWASAGLLQMRYYRLGVYRCFYCGTARRRNRLTCNCLAGEARPEPRPHRPMRHYRRQVPAVLLTYLAAGLIVWFISTRVPPERVTPAWLAFGHACLCVLVGVLVELVSLTLEFLRRGKRFRLRAVIFRRVLAVWPLLFIIAAIVNGLRS
jgi:hypothetical protein